MANALEVSYLELDKVYHSLEEVELDELKMKKSKRVDLSFHYSNKSLLLKVTVGPQDFLEGETVLIYNEMSPEDYKIYNENIELIATHGEGMDEGPFPSINITPYQSIAATSFYFLRNGTMRSTGRFQVISPEDLRAKEKKNEYRSIFFLGILSFVVIFSFGYFIVARSKLVIYYTCLNIFYGWLILNYSFFHWFMTGNNNHLRYIHLGAGLACAFSMKFAREFLSLERYMKKKLLLFYDILSHALFTMALLSAVVPFSIKHFFSISIDTLIVVFIGTVFSFSLLLWKRNIFARFFLLSWVFQMIGGGLFLMYVYTKFTPSFELIRFSMMMGCTCEMLVNSFAIAYKGILTEREKIEVNQRAREKTAIHTRLRVLSHDLAQPIGSLNGLVFKLPSDGLGLKEGITKNLKRIEKIMVNASKIDESFSAPKSESSFKESFKKLHDHFQSSLKSKNLKLNLVDSPDITIPMRRDTLVENILGNLISNAIKFTHENGKIEVAAFEGHGKVVIRVRDFGVGLSQDSIEKFYIESIDHTLGTSNEVGRGLGLKIVKNILKEHNAVLDVSAHPEGSDFTVTFYKDETIFT